MRASTLFAITLSLLLGLGAAATARYAGFFDKKELLAEPPKPATKVLVARSNLIEEAVVSADQVMVRDLRPEEEQLFRAKPDKYLPPMVMAAHMRVPKRHILADTPLMNEYFEEFGPPEQLSTRLDPGTRSVNIPVLKDKAAGGVIRKNEYVDVLLTTSITSPGSDTPTMHTACIARGAKVIMKRNTLQTIMIADPENQPIYFGLQVNPYRAALIEFATRRGSLSLLPVPTVSRKSSPGNWSDPASKEYADEDQRVDMVNRGEYSVSDRDLERIFNLMPPTPELPPIRVRHVNGINLIGQSVFPSEANVSSVLPNNGGSAPAGNTNKGFIFSSSDETDPKKCKNCSKK